MQQLAQTVCLHKGSVGKTVTIPSDGLFGQYLTAAHNIVHCYQNGKKMAVNKVEWTSWSGPQLNNAKSYLQVMWVLAYKKRARQWLQMPRHSGKAMHCGNFCNSVGTNFLNNVYLNVEWVKNFRLNLVKQNYSMILFFVCFALILQSIETLNHVPCFNKDWKHLGVLKFLTEVNKCELNSPLNEKFGHFHNELVVESKIYISSRRWGDFFSFFYLLSLCFAVDCAEMFHGGVWSGGMLRSSLLRARGWYSASGSCTFTLHRSLLKVQLTKIQIKWLMFIVHNFEFELNPLTKKWETSL